MINDSRITCDGFSEEICHCEKFCLIFVIFPEGYMCSELVRWFSLIITDISLHSGAHQGARSTIGARDSSSMVCFFIRLPFNALIHGKSPALILMLMLYVVCFVCANLLIEIYEAFFVQFARGVHLLFTIRAKKDSNFCLLSILIILLFSMFFS